MIDDLKFLKKKFMNKGLSLIDLFEITFCSHRNKNICSVVLFHTVIRYIYFMEKQKKKCDDVFAKLCLKKFIHLSNIFLGYVKYLIT